MENATKALEMAAGVLLGVILMTLIAYFFSEIRLWPEKQDEMETAEQISTFNLEYEVYEKKKMYGADVISCLTKAQSNNEKYVDGGEFLTGNRYGDEYWINVYVNLKNDDLKENVEVYYYGKDGTGTTKRLLLPAGENTGVTMGDAGFVFDDDASRNYSTFTRATPLTGRDAELSGGNFIQAGSRSHRASTGSGYDAVLFTSRNTNDTTPLQNLVRLSSSNMKQTVTNNTGSNLDKWCAAIWETGLYDFKTRLFTCDSIEYSNVTGRVNEIFFSEI